MPKVIVTRNPVTIDDRAIVVLGQILPVIVAARLSCEGGKLDESEVEVKVQDVGPFDVNCKDLMIEIIANGYPDRIATMAERRAAVEKDVLAYNAKHSLFSCLQSTGYVWLQLPPATFGEF